MHLTITKFQVSPHLTEADVVSMFEQSTERYAQIPGLLAKHYFVGPGRQAGGVYLWENEAQAKAVLGAEFAEAIRQRFGSAPTVESMYCPLSLDNARRSVRIA
ncbi:YdhR family protein [Candidimonas nitroreducens]|uniref:Monooxygenase n=1 Tax=Candidimonas nitroreducens TaxID=683354 RepID=A0A225MQG9_9BURK|nr:YdhR family protein [Candidimonas nitroreducens]OWT63518.1 hypothetical protein CEY11_04085 [Candidimonas nitroreducens]